MSDDIFISYSSEDLERIQPIIQVLERRGWSVWWDRKIPLGKTFDEVIEEAIDTAKCIIVVWTKTSVTSQWVRTEASEGERRGILIPILLDDVKIPLAFKRIETARLMDWDGVYDHPELDVLLEAITRFVGKPPIAEPDRPVPEKVGLEPRETGMAQREWQEREAAKRRPVSRTVVRKTETKPWRTIPKWIWICGAGVGIIILLALGVGSVTQPKSVTYTMATHVAEIAEATANAIRTEEAKATADAVRAQETIEAARAEGRAAAEAEAEATATANALRVAKTLAAARTAEAMRVAESLAAAAQTAQASVTESARTVAAAEAAATVNAAQTVGALATAQRAESIRATETAEAAPAPPGIMARVPAGEFIIGSTDADVDSALAVCNEYIGDCQRSLFENEQSQHTVYLDAFYIDETEVTNAQFAQFLNEQGNQEEGGVTWLDIGDEDCLIAESGGQYWPKSGYGDHPVIEVSWYGARAYCQWAGGRLPTEAEWEKAARGTDGRTYPWGNAFDGSWVNFCDRNCEFDWKDTGADDGYARTAPVGSYPAGASPYGLLDMAGSVWEWVADWYDSGYYASSPESNPKGPASGDKRVIRGGSWFSFVAYVRAAIRLGVVPNDTLYDVGFRCARSP